MLHRKSNSNKLSSSNHRRATRQRNSNIQTTSNSRHISNRHIKDKHTNSKPVLHMLHSALNKTWKDNARSRRSVSVLGAVAEFQTTVSALTLAVGTISIWVTQS